VRYVHPGSQLQETFEVPATMVTTAPARSSRGSSTRNGT
jgi:hypothetical protein